MKYTMGVAPRDASGHVLTHPSGRPRPPLRGREAVLPHVRSAFASLDGTRRFNLLEEYRRCYGRLARERARASMQHWRDGGPIHADETTARLTALLVHHLTPDEMLTLLRGLRERWVADLPRSTARVTVARGDDLLAAARRVGGSVRRVQARLLPRDLLSLLGWPDDTDAPALRAVILGAERYLTTHRLAALMRHLGTLARLRSLASPGMTVRVCARVEVPTLVLHLRFQPCFWAGDGSLCVDQDLLVRLQDLVLGGLPSDAINEPREDAGHKGDAERRAFADHVLGGLTGLEHARLQEMTVSMGLCTESLLRELRVQTLAARADIEVTIAAVEKMRRAGFQGRVVSEHSVPCCASTVEVRSGGCPLSRLIVPFSSWR